MNPKPLRVRLDELRKRRGLAAVRHLRDADRRLAQIIDRVGAHRPIITRDPFRTLVGSITSQQVSMSAAAAIQKRIKALCPGGRVTPKALLALTPQQLRSAGLSNPKCAYMHGLAEEFASGKLSTRKLRAMSDDEVIETTTRVKGIGRWTAEMLLIFCLERPDVWPVDDLGVRKAVQNLWTMRELPPAKAIRDLADPWRPYRSYATWYLWRSLEGPLMPGTKLL